MRRFGLASVLALGLSLLAMGFHGVTRVDANLEAATPPPAHHATFSEVSERDCPRERRRHSF